MKKTGPLAPVFFFWKLRENIMRFILILSMVMVLGACSESSENSNHAETITAPASRIASFGGASADMAVAQSMAVGMASPAPLQKSAPPSTMVLDRSKFNGRRIAETHNMEIETAFDGLQARYQADYAKCVELGCEISFSNVQMAQGGQINARIAPEKLGAFLDFLADGPGKILNHSVSADDQTMAYSDTKAEMDNLLALRDRLHALLSSRETAKIKDILDLERELTRVQTEIDSRTQRLRILEQITNMATVNLNYRVEYRPVQAKKYTLANTWDMTVQNFLYAIDSMARFVGGILPWLPVMFGGFWLVVRMIRLAFAKVSFPWPRKRKSAPPAAP